MTHGRGAAAQRAEDDMDIIKRYKAGERDFSGANLSYTDLSRAALRGANLSGANLSAANLSGANLSGANLSGADLRSADLRDANLSGANLSAANLSYTDLSRANLSGADLRSAALRDADLRDANLSAANLSGADLSGAQVLPMSTWMLAHFDRDDRGFAVYKAIGNTHYDPRADWVIEPGEFLEEVVNSNRTDECGCGVNFGTLAYVREQFPNATVWKCRIRFEDSPGIVVPYNTDGKARCERLELLEVYHE